MKHIKKRISLIVIFVGITIFGYFYGEEYTSFHDSLKKYEQQSVSEKASLLDFSFTALSPIEDISLITTPDKKALDTIIGLIGKTDKHIFLNVYMLTEKRIRQALIKAKKRGIDVKIILEKNVYKSPRINNDAYDELLKNNIDIIWSDTPGISLNHAKYMILDEKLLLGTGNFTFSTFTKNRDLFILTSDTKIVTSFKKLFFADFKNEKLILSEKHILVSPWSARYKIEYAIQSAQKSIFAYIPYIESDSIKELLISAKKRGVDIYIVTNKSEKDSFSSFEDIGVNVYYRSKTVHAKTLLIDDTYLLLGSTNFSNPSFDKNREAGLVIVNQAIVQEYKKLFSTDMFSQ